MPYRPNYCSHCGENIVRTDWKLWTSTRFCENCEGAFKQIDWLPKIGLAFAVIGGLFGFGSYLKTPEKPLALTTNQVASNGTVKSQTLKNEPLNNNANVQNITVNKSVPANIVKENKINAESVQKPLQQQNQTQTPQIVESEPVYFCGAQTKKGTPCTRKVKGGRCWQHTGLPAMLAKEKLAAGQ